MRTFKVFVSSVPSTIKFAVTIPVVKLGVTGLIFIIVGLERHIVAQSPSKNHRVPVITTLPANGGDITRLNEGS